MLMNILLSSGYDQRSLGMNAYICSGTPNGFLGFCRCVSNSASISIRRRLAVTSQVYVGMHLEEARVRFV